MSHTQLKRICGLCLWSHRVCNQTQCTFLLSWTLERTVRHVKLHSIESHQIVIDQAAIEGLAYITTSKKYAVAPL